MTVELKELLTYTVSTENINPNGPNFINFGALQMAVFYECSICGKPLTLRGTFTHWIFEGHKLSRKVTCELDDGYKQHLANWKEKK